MTKIKWPTNKHINTGYHPVSSVSSTVRGILFGCGWPA